MPDLIVEVKDGTADLNFMAAPYNNNVNHQYSIPIHILYGVLNAYYESLPEGLTSKPV